MILNFKFKQGDIVNFNIAGEKHMGKIISGGFYIDAGEGHRYYSVSEINSNVMLAIDEEELEKSSYQEMSDKLLDVFAKSLWGGKEEK